jgi:hypothetical protein
MITPFFVLLLIAILNRTASASSELIQSCLSQGFDPSNLSCDTCVLLQDTDYHLVCLECCQSYKTLESRTSRYQHAVLMHVEGVSEEMDAFVKEAADQVQESKRGFRVELAPRAAAMGFFTMRPNVLYFYKQNAPPVGTTNREYAETASEEIVLYGWSKDDLKDMLLTLLPDKKTTA